MQYAYFDQQITTTRHMWHADLGHTVTDTLHIFRAARVKAELRKQTGSSVPKARNLKLYFRQYPAIHTNYSWSNCTISN